MKDLNFPVAKKKEEKLQLHGDTRIDNYFWMKLSDEQKNSEEPDAQTKEVVSYLEAENAYTKKLMTHTEEFQEKLFNEIVGRIKQTDMSVPYKSNGYFYITRYEEGKEYAIHSRKKESLDAAEEIMLNVNKLAEGLEFYNVGGMSVSPDNMILAYSEDKVSRRIYTIKFKNLVTGEMLEDIVENTSGSAVWANDNKTIFYTRKDEALRSFKVFRHTLGTSASEDVEVYHESDETYSAFVYKTKSKKYIVLGSYATVSQEYQILDADNPTGEFTMFQKRERDLEYGISHFQDKWYIRTNLGAKNFRLMSSSLDKTSKDNWSEVIAHRDDVLLEGVDIFHNHLVLSERINGLMNLRIRPWNDSEEHYISFGEEAFLMYTGTNPEFDTDVLRIGYTSMTTPNSTYDYDMNSKDKTLLKQQEVVGEFNSDDYASML